MNTFMTGGQTQTGNGLGRSCNDPARRRIYRLPPDWANQRYLPAQTKNISSLICLIISLQMRSLLPWQVQRCRYSIKDWPQPHGPSSGYSHASHQSGNAKLYASRARTLSIPLLRSYWFVWRARRKAPGRLCDTAAGLYCVTEGTEFVGQTWMWYAGRWRVGWVRAEGGHRQLWRRDCSCGEITESTEHA